VISGFWWVNLIVRRAVIGGIDTRAFGGGRQQGPGHYVPGMPGLVWVLYFNGIGRELTGETSLSDVLVSSRAAGAAGVRTNQNVADGVWHGGMPRCARVNV
jgi:hypothetical protein